MGRGEFKGALSDADRALEVGRGAEILALGGETLPSRWIEAARLWASGDLAGAADRFEEIGSVADEALARLNEAKRLILEDRRVEARRLLSRVQELLQRMGATALLRETRQLLVAAA